MSTYVTRAEMAEMSESIRTIVNELSIQLLSVSIALQGLLDEDQMEACRMKAIATFDQMMTAAGEKDDA